MDPSPPAWAAHALYAAAHGDYVFPLLDKHIIPVRWGSEASRSPEKIARWAREFPRAAGYGIALRADQYVFDADTPEAVEWCRANMPPTYEVGTGRPGGGVHFYFHVPNGRRLRMLNTKLGETLGAGVRGLDGKTKGGYVVGPGSLHKSGTTYLVLADARPAALPHRVMKKIGDRPEVADSSTSGGLTATEAAAYAAHAAWGDERLVEEARQEFRLTGRQLRAYLRENNEGWSDEFLTAGNRLGPYVAMGACTYEQAVAFLERIFEDEDHWRVPGSNVPRSIRRGIAHAARREVETWL